MKFRSRFALRIILSGLVFLIATPPSGQTQVVSSQGKLHFTVDAANFWQNPQTSYIEVYYKIANSEFQFTKKNNIYRARFDLSIVLYNQHGSQVTGNRWEYPIELKDPGEISTAYTYSQVRFITEPGEYKIKVQIEDLNNKKFGNAELKIQTPAYPKDQVSFSSIQFAESILPESTDGPYTKHGFYIEPNTSRTFGENQKDFYFYSELFVDEKNYGDYEVEFQVLNNKDSLSINNRQNIAIKSPITPIKGVADISKFTDGKYRLRLNATNVATSQKLSKEGDFTVVWSPVTWGGDFDESLHQILYLATPQELKSYKKLKKAPEADRSAFMVAFWARRDPVKRTPQNEAMVEHYRRYKYAIEHFSSAMPGWRTDMGRIHIKFGEPDEIERHPFDSETRPYEIWIYYKCGHRFVFVDEGGYGRYSLAQPQSEDVYAKECFETINIIE